VLRNRGIQIAGSLRIETFEGSRPRLRRTRQGYGRSIDPGSFWAERLRSREALKADDGGRGGGSAGLRVLSDGNFRCGFSLLVRLRHTSATRAGASACLGDEGRLRRVSEALPADRSPDHLLWSEPFDERHESAATGAEPGTRRLGFRFYGILRWRGCEKLPADGQQDAAAPVSEEAAKSDTYKTARQSVEQEPPKELLGGYGHQPLFVRIVFPAERDFAVGKVHNPVIGNGDSVSVAGQIMEDMFGASKWPFRVDHPGLAKQRPKEGVESLALGEHFQLAGEQQFSGKESAFQAVNELTAESMFGVSGAAVLPPQI
jgi:hypothetical protein